MEARASMRQLTSCWGIVPLALALGAHSRAQQEAAFTDPAPPEVRAVPAAKAAEASAYSELTFHRAPGPLARDAVTEDWPAFLGPRRDQHSRETRLAASWPEGGPPLVWEMRCGSGFASPVVASMGSVGAGAGPGAPAAVNASDRRLVFTHRVGNEIHVDCLDPETGRRFWRFSYGTEYKDRYNRDDGPRSTPAIAPAGDGEPARVYVHALENALYCLDLASGTVVWQRDLAREFGVPLDFFGSVSSPLLYRELLVQNIGAVGGPCVAAFDRRTGKLAWGAGSKWGPSCASPVIGSVGGRERLFVLAGGESKPAIGGLLVLDPADGTLVFEYPFRSKVVESVTGSSPVIAGNSVFLSSSYGVGSACLAAREDGGFEELWTNRHIGLQFQTAIHERGYLWAIDGVADRAGAFVCLDPATGKELGRTDLVLEETFEHEGEEKTIQFTVGEGSLLHAEGRFLCLGDNGHLLWLEATPERATIRARAWLFRANQSWTPPVVSRGLLYVRQTGAERFGDAPARLLCYDLRAR